MRIFRRKKNVQRESEPDCCPVCGVSFAMLPETYRRAALETHVRGCSVPGREGI